MMETVEYVRVEYKLLSPLAKLPTKAHKTDAAWDIYSIEDLDIKPGETVDIETGLIYVVPSGYYITINGRSSMNKKGLIPFRGIIDSGYTGQMMVMLTNTSDKLYHISIGDRIAQITIHKNEIVPINVEIKKSENFSDDYNMRGTNGFGSSGK